LGPRGQCVISHKISEACSHLISCFTKGSDFHDQASVWIGARAIAELGFINCKVHKVHKVHKDFPGLAVSKLTDSAGEPSLRTKSLC
jgi:hypothetical protein